MRAKNWVAAITVIAFIAVLLPQTQLGNKTRQPAPQLHAKMMPEQEEDAKVKTMKRDMDATAQLLQDETKKDLLQLLSKTRANTGKNVAANHNTIKHALQELHQEHPYIAYTEYHGKNLSTKIVAYGKLPVSKESSAERFQSEAEQALTASTPYISELFYSDTGSLFRLIAVPDPLAPGTGALAVIQKDVIKSVEAHQKRNLRLIPYPDEGNYRIESVLPNSTVDIAIVDGEDNGNASHYYINDVAVHFKQPLTEVQLQQIKTDIEATSVQHLNENYVFRSKSMDAKKLIAYFEKNWKAAYAEPHYLYMTNDAVKEQFTQSTQNEQPQTIIPNDVLYSRYQWNLPSIETEKGWNISRGKDDVIVAVLDTGVQSNHPDITGRLTGGRNIVDTSKTPEDDVGHGTHVAGIIGATVNNNEGVAGVSWYNKIMPVKVLDQSGAGSSYAVAQGIIWAVDNGAKVINMSLGNYANAQFLHDAVKYAYERDVVLVAASGNDNTDRPGYPAAYPEVFAVGATNSAKQRASFSNYGDYIDVAAPGESIASTYPHSQYAALSGTSMATPHVAALAGLIRSVNPELTNDEVMSIMRSTAIDLGEPGKDPYFGYGEIDAQKALTAALEYKGSLQMYPSQVKKRLNKISSGL